MVTHSLWGGAHVRSPCPVSKLNSPAAASVGPLAPIKFVHQFVGVDDAVPAIPLHHILRRIVTNSIRPVEDPIGHCPRVRPVLDTRVVVTDGQTSCFQRHCIKDSMANAMAALLPNKRVTTEPPPRLRAGRDRDDAQHAIAI